MNFLNQIIQEPNILSTIFLSVALTPRIFLEFHARNHKAPQKSQKPSSISIHTPLKTDDTQKLYPKSPKPPPSTTMTKSKEAGVEPRQPQMKRCIAVVFLVLILITLFLVVVIWLAVQPKKLIYTIEHSSINGYNYTRGGDVNATFHCVLRSKNPNKRVSFYFKRIDLEATYYGKKLFAGNVGPFRQPVRNVTDLEVDVVAVGAALRGKAAEELSAEKAAGSVKMEVKVVGKVNMKIGVFKVHRTVTALCGPYDVPFSEAKGFRKVDCDTDISY